MTNVERMGNGEWEGGVVNSWDNLNRRVERRSLLAGGLGILAGGVTIGGASRIEAHDGADNPDTLVASIEKVTLRRGRDGSGPTWFHPRATMIPAGDTPGGGATPTAFMTLQTIAGSDYFGPVHWSTSTDLGRTWTDPAPVPALGRVPAADGWQEAVCDVVPQWHAKTGTVLALGHNVFYRGPKFDRNQPRRRPVYAVWRSGAAGSGASGSGAAGTGAWSERRVLEWDDPRGTFIYTNNCGQRVTLPDGDVLLAFTFGPDSKAARAVAGVRCSFDGETLRVKQVGTPHENPHGRGLLEPSLVEYRRRFYLTMRAEDQRGYVAASDDGLEYSAKQAWTWDDGEPLVMSTTQQHWLAHSDGLYLVYTRRDASNVNVFRWRSPLWMAQVDLETLRLKRATERVVLPMTGDGVNDPDKVALSGNFHITNASPDESWVTDGEILVKQGYRGDLLLARIRWSKPNSLMV